MPGRIDDLTSYRILAAVSELGSITRAAERLGVSQQAASARIRALERRLGLSLLRRSRRGSALTADGLAVAAWADDVEQAVSRLEAGVAALREEAGSTAVAASLTIAEHLLPRWLLAVDGPARQALAVTAANSREVVERVRSGAAQLGFVESPASLPGLVPTVFARDELVLVAAPTHPGAAVPVSLAEAAALPLVTREEGSGTRASWEGLLRAAGLTPAAPAVELPTTSAVRTAIAAGPHAGVLSILAVRDDLASGRLVRVPIHDARTVRELRVVWRPDQQISAAATALLEAARGLGAGSLAR